MSTKTEAKRWLPYVSHIEGFRGIYLFDDGKVLAERWHLTPSCDDGTISAVLADWIEERFLEVCSIPGNREVDVRVVIEDLHQRATNNNGEFS